MKDTISIIFAALIGTFLIVIMPLYSILDRQDSMSYNVVLTQTTKFVDDIRNNGFITKESYYDYISALATTSNSYKVSIEAYKRTLIRDTDEDGNIIKDSFVEEVELYNTKDILEVLEAETVNKEANDIGKNNTYLLNENDEIYVRVYNTNITSGSIIYSMFTNGKAKADKVINVSYGGVVNNVNWELYNKLQQETAKIPEIVFSVPVNYNDSTNIKKLTSTGEVIDIDCDNPEGYTEDELQLYCQDINEILKGEIYTYLYNLELPENQTIKTSVELYRFDSINIGVNKSGSEKYIKLSELTEEIFQNSKYYIIEKFIELNGMYADIDLEYRQKGDYYVFDIILTNIRMSSLDYISNLASISILPGLGKDVNGIPSLGGETVAIELMNKELSHSVVISSPYNWKKLLKTSLRDSRIIDGRVYVNEELAFVLSYTGIDMEDRTEQDVVNAVKNKLKIYTSQTEHSIIEVYTMKEITEKYGDSIAKELNRTSYSNHLLIKFTYSEPSISSKNYIELEDGWIETGLYLPADEYGVEEAVTAKGSKSGEYYIINDDEPPVEPEILLEGIRGRNDWFTSDVNLHVVSSKVDTIKQKDFQMKGTSNTPVIGGSGLYKNTLKITGVTSLDETEVLEHLISSQGISQAVAYAYDYVGNKVETRPVEVKIDKTAPTEPSLQLQGKQGLNGWFIGDVTVDIKPGTDDVSGVDKTTYTVQGADAKRETTGTTVKITKSGHSKVIATTYDKAGNKTTATIDIYLDKGLPVDAKIEVISGDKNAPTNEWYKSDVELRVIIPEGENIVSGISSAYYSIAGGSVVEKTIIDGKTENIGINSNGTHTITVYTYTNAGNVTETKYTVKIDKDAPNIPTVLVSGVFGDNGWYNVPVSITVKSNRDIGPSLEHFLSYTLDNSVNVSEEQVIEDNGRIVISNSGVYKVNVYSRDYAGNKSSKQENVKIDLDAPISPNFIINGTKGKNEWYISDVKISHDEASDSVSGVASIELSTESITSNTKGQTVEIITRDNAGNMTQNSVVIKVDKEAPTGLNIQLDEPTGNGIFGVNIYNKDVNVKVIPGIDFVEDLNTVDKTTVAIYKTVNEKTETVLREQEYTEEFMLNENGKYNVVARTYDKAGNIQEVSKIIWINKSDLQAPKIVSVNGVDYSDSTIVDVEDASSVIQIGVENVEIGNTINITLIDEEYNSEQISVDVTDDTFVIDISLNKKGKYTIVLNQKNMYGTTSSSSSSMTYEYN